MQTNIYAVIAGRLMATQNAEINGNKEWLFKHEERIHEVEKNYLPSGCGFDAGTTLDFDHSTPERLVFKTSFHHLDDVGGYDGWTDHEVIITASLYLTVNLHITGDNRNGIFDYIAEAFYHLADQKIEF